MRIAPPLAILAIFFALAQGSAQEPADKAIDLRKYHGWGRFPAGAWRLVRVTKESLDEKGEVTSVSVTESRTSMESVDEHQFKLLTESKIDIAGRRYVPEPQRATRDFFGVPKEKAVMKKVRDTDFVLNGQTTKCLVYEVVINNENSKRVTRFTIPADGSHLVLRQSTTANSAEGQSIYQIDVDVLATGMPLRVMANTLSCSYLRTVQQTPDKKIVTVEAYSPDVPGGVVNQSVKVMNRAGRTIERHTSELVDYGRVPAAQPAAFNVRSWMYRHRRTRR